MKLGEILIQQKSITEDQLELALWVQRRWGGLLGRILCSRGMLHEPDLVAALSGQLGVPAVELRSRCMPTCVCHLVPQDLCVSHLLLPFGRDPDSGVLQVAMADPRDATGLAALRGCLQGPYRIYLCGYIDLTDALFWQTRLKTDAQPTPEVRRPTQEIIEADLLVEEVAIPAPVQPRRAARPVAGDDLEVLEESDMLAVMTAQARSGRPPEVDLIVESGDFEVVSSEELAAEPAPDATGQPVTEARTGAPPETKAPSGESKDAPGDSKDAPKQAKDAPGDSKDAPKQAKEPPKQAKDAPKQAKDATTTPPAAAIDAPKDTDSKAATPPARRGLLAALAGAPREPEKKAPDKKPPPSPFDAREKK